MSVDVSRVWAGVEESQRKARWSERIDRKLLDWKLTLSSLNPAVKDEIDLQLQPGFFAHFTPPLTAKDLEDVRLVLRMDACFNHRSSIVDGQAQLCARLLTALGWDTRLAFATLQSLNSQLKAEHADPSRYKADALVLTAVLSREVPELVAHFNSTGFDVVDLSDQLSAFLPCVYAVSFPAELVSRCVDCMLLDPLGTSFLFSVFYGVLRVHVKTLLQQSDESIFQFIADLPHSLTRQQVTDAFIFAYKAVRSKAEPINAERRKKSWTHAIAHPGPILFAVDVGDASAPPAPPRPGPPSAASTGALSGSGVVSGPSTVAASRVVSGTATPVPPLSPTSANSPGDSGVVFNLRDLSADRGGGGGGATPPTAALLQQLAGAEKESDVPRLRELVRAAQAHIRATTPPPPLPTSAPMSATVPLPAVGAGGPAPLPPAKVPTGSTIKHADLAEYLQLPCVHMEGWLLKSRQAGKFLGMKTKKAGHSTLSSGLFGVTLHRRLFVLEGEFLAYYKQRGEKAPARGEALWVRSCWVEELSEKEFGQWGYGFEIRMKVKTAAVQGASSKAAASATEPLFVLFTNSAKERQTWVEVLKKATGQSQS